MYYAKDEKSAVSYEVDSFVIFAVYSMYLPKLILNNVLAFFFQAFSCISEDLHVKTLFKYCIGVWVTFLRFHL